MPLAFIEVKKPHNKEGIIAERNRINARFKNKHFRSFVNITQLMVFSNNMEYEDGIVEPIFGAFYAASAYSDLSFNYFREDEDYPVIQKLKTISEQEENYFASNLLMPEQKTRNAFSAMLTNSRKAKVKDYLHVTNNWTFGIWCGIRDDLMKRYGVSEAALRYRLQQLNLAKFEFVS
jgi:hypothetical protein